MIITHGGDFLSGCPCVTIFVETLSGEWLQMGASGELAGRGQWFWSSAASGTKILPSKLTGFEYAYKQRAPFTAT